jgi:hypothetical protein
MTVHSDSTSAIARASHTGAGPGQNVAQNIRNMVCSLRNGGKTVDIVWVKGHQGTPGNDTLARKAAEKAGYSRVMSIAHLRLRISEKFRNAKRPRTITGGSPTPGRSPAWTACGMRWPEQRRRYARPLEVRGLPQADPKNGGRQVLVLPEFGPDESLSRTTSLPPMNDSEWRGWKHGRERTPGGSGCC